MRTALILTLFAVVIHSVAAESTPSISTQNSPEIEVIDKQFGLLQETDKGRILTPAATVPLIEDQAYGWRMKVKSEQTTLVVREELELPVAPKTWGDPDPARVISDDGKTCVTTRSLTPDVEGCIQNVWFVAPDDPAGTYVIRVFIDSKLAATFEFIVQ